MKILIFGDVFGRTGLEALRETLPRLRAAHALDLVVANAENLANGKGLTAKLLSELFALGVDVATTGDHAWDERAGISLFDTEAGRLLRPANFPPGVPGRGWTTLTHGVTTVAVVNLIGRVFFRSQYDDPFRAAEAILSALPRVQPLVILVDLHAEATSEKRALAFFLDGKVTALWGTHTHVPTADEQLLPNGTAYLTDVGMTGSLNSVIGLPSRGVIDGLRLQMGMGLKPESARPWEVNAALLDIDEASGKARAIQQIREILP